MALAGFNNWKPNDEAELILGAVMKVFEEYRDHLPLTGRQVFYRLVGAYGYEKSERAANRLYKILGRARRAGVLPFNYLRDGGSQKAIPRTYADESAFWDHVDREFQHYNRNRQKGQPQYIELFCEAPGMMPQLQRIAFDYSIPVYGTRGYTGLSVVGEVARRALMRDQPTTILQIGDLDPSGVGIYETLRTDVKAFVQQCVSTCRKGKPILAERLGVTSTQTQAILLEQVDPAIEFERIALTWDQVDEHGLPTAPPSSKDSRTVNWPYDDTAQAEALPPDLLAQIVRESIEREIDMRVYQDEVDLEEADKDEISDKLESIRS